MDCPGCKKELFIGAADVLFSAGPPQVWLVGVSLDVCFACEFHGDVLPELAALQRLVRAALKREASVRLRFRFDATRGRWVRLVPSKTRLA